MRPIRALKNSVYAASIVASTSLWAKSLFIIPVPRNQPEIPESRTYRHQKCGAETVISGEAYAALSDPLSDMSRNSCNEFFPLADHEWSDTGETITDYYARHSARATGLERFLCSRRFLVISAVIAFPVGAASRA